MENYYWHVPLPLGKGTCRIVNAVLDESRRDKLKAAKDKLTLMLLGQFNDLEKEDISRITRLLGRIVSLSGCRKATCLLLWKIG